MNCSCNYNACACKIVGIFIAVILAVVFGALFFFGLLPFIFPVLLVALIFAAVFLVLLVIGLLISPNISVDVRRCLCDNIALALTGAIGTIILAMLAIAVALTPLSLASAIIIALGALFFILLLTAIVCFIRCILESTCDDVARR